MSDPQNRASGPDAIVPGARMAGDGPDHPAKIFPFPFHETTLPNGLRVVVVRHDSPGIVAFWVIVRAGSRDEVEPGRSGFAHFFEHMMFRGTERFSREAYNAVLKELGADHNAFTTDDYTAYHILAPASSIDTLMTIEADRFRNLKYPVEDFKKEAGAVLGEYNKSAASPLQTLHEKLRETAFTDHTYRHTTIGFLKDIQAMPDQYSYSLEFFDRFYRPENGILLVVGDVDPAQVLALAREHFGSWEKGGHVTQAPDEPRQQGERRLELTWPTPTQPYLFGGYRGPAFSIEEPDLAALDLAGQLLFSDSAPLYQKLVVEDQIVDLLHGGAEDHRDPYLFSFLARVKKESDIAAVETAITAALEGLARDPVPAGRLTQVQSHFKYGFAMGLDTASGTARSLAHYLALTGEAETVNRLYAMYDRMTPEMIRAAARKYFLPSGRTVVTLRHRSPRAGGAAPAAGHP
jgi:zinc protease